MRKQVAAALFLTLSLLLLPQRGARASEVGQPAPALVIPLLDGQPFDLAAQRGKVVIVNFWATWCAPCREEMPALDAFYRRHRSEGIEMIGLSVDRERDRDAVRAAMRSFAYPAALVGDARTNDFPRPKLLPITYIVDAAGMLRAKMTPGQIAVTEQSLTATVLPLLPQTTQPRRGPSMDSAAR